jgi:tetratricopeptide (TPR) repeat protein
MRARAYKRLGNNESAADDYTSALQTGEQLSPNGLFFLYYNRGLAYLATKEYNRAAADFEKAAALHPDDADPHKYRARALEGANRKAEAKKEKDKEAELRKLQPADSK